MREESQKLLRSSHRRTWVVQRRFRANGVDTATLRVTCANPRRGLCLVPLSPHLQEPATGQTVRNNPITPEALTTECKESAFGTAVVPWRWRSDSTIRG